MKDQQIKSEFIPNVKQMDSLYKVAESYFLNILTDLRFKNAAENAPNLDDMLTERLQDCDTWRNAVLEGKSLGIPASAIKDSESIAISELKGLISHKLHDAIRKKDSREKEKLTKYLKQLER